MQGGCNRAGARFFRPVPDFFVELTGGWYSDTRTPHEYARDRMVSLTAARYVALNPVRARLVKRAEDWRWSSVGAHLAGLEPITLPGPPHTHPGRLAPARIHHHGRRENQIPIALAAQPEPNFPRLRALALFGCRPPECEASLVMPASKNLHRNEPTTIPNSECARSREDPRHARTNRGRSRQFRSLSVRLPLP